MTDVKRLSGALQVWQGQRARSRATAIAIGASCLVLASLSARADGFDPNETAVQRVLSVAAGAAGTGGAGTARDEAARPKKRALQPAKRDPLAVEPAVAVKEEPQKSLDLPGVMKLDGASRDLLDPTRVRRISWTNGASQTIYVSATQPNRIQLPFVNPKVISTDDVDIDKRASGNNVYVTFKTAVPVAVQVWIEPLGESSQSVGLQLVPKAIPAQSIIVVDDTVIGSAGRSQRTGSGSELTRLQAVLEEAALGGSPGGYSVVELKVPPIAVNGVVVEGLRRLSGRSDDVYVYAVTNPGVTDIELREAEFDGPDVRAVSIMPRPLVHPGERVVVTVLAQKRSRDLEAAAAAAARPATPPSSPSAAPSTAPSRSNQEGQ